MKISSTLKTVGKVTLGVAAIAGVGYIAVKAKNDEVFAAGLKTAGRFAGVGALVTVGGAATGGALGINDSDRVTDLNEAAGFIAKNAVSGAIFGLSVFGMLKGMEHFEQAVPAESA